MKSIIKKIIALTNYQLVLKSKISRKEDSSNRTMKSALLHILNLQYKANCIVDVGAGSGTQPLLEVFPNAEYILIEPLIEFFPQLEALKEKYNVKKIIIAAAGTEFNDLVINVHPDLYGSSLLQENEGSNADGIPRKIKMIQLKDEIAHLNNKLNNILKVDVQGSELNVLKSAGEFLHLFDVIILEVSFFNFQKSSPEFSDVISFMNLNDYVIYDMFDFNVRPLDNALAQVDILFVKRNGMFRRSHNYAYFETRAKMNNV